MMFCYIVLSGIRLRNEGNPRAQVASWELRPTCKWPQIRNLSCHLSTGVAITIIAYISFLITF
jgi:hypothetical protein